MPCVGNVTFLNQVLQCPALVTWFLLFLSTFQKCLETGENKKCIETGHTQHFPPPSWVPKARSGARDVYNSWTGHHLTIHSGPAGWRPAYIQKAGDPVVEIYAHFRPIFLGWQIVSANFFAFWMYEGRPCPCENNEKSIVVKIGIHLLTIL